MFSPFENFCAAILAQLDEFANADEAYWPLGIECDDSAGGPFSSPEATIEAIGRGIRAATLSLPFSIQTDLSQTLSLQKAVTSHLTNGVLAHILRDFAKQ
jgi:hypothetical protein